MVCADNWKISSEKESGDVQGCVHGACAWSKSAISVIARGSLGREICSFGGWSYCATLLLMVALRRRVAGPCTY